MSEAFDQDEGGMADPDRKGKSTKTGVQIAVGWRPGIEEVASTQSTATQNEGNAYGAAPEDFVEGPTLNPPTARIYAANDEVG